MNPACPRAQVFTAGVIKSVASDGQKTKRAEEERSVAAIPTGAPGEADVTVEKHSDQDQDRHRSGAMDLHRPRFRIHLEITWGRNEIIPIRPCRAAEKKQRKYAIEQASVKRPQSD